MSESVPLIIGFQGKQLDEATKAHLKEINPAGVILFQRNLGTVDEIKALTAEIRQLLGPVIIAIDHEGGPVNRFSPELAVPPAPFALNFTSADDQRQATQMLAALPAHCGFNLNLAPVMDLFDANSAAINIRAFSRDPEEVGRWASLVFEAHDEVGLGCCGKHFPGHGRVDVDTHFESGRVDFDADELERLDMLPYRRVGLPAIMTSHLVYTNLDAERPASLSKPIITDLLKGKMGFKGLVISDCVEMEAISGRFSAQEIVRFGAEAGLDLWISSFSLKGDLQFQKDLAHEMRSLGLSGHQSKVRDFLTDFPGRRTQLFTLDEAVNLRKKCIQKGGAKPAPPWQLVYITSKAFEGINAEPLEGSFSDWMAQGLGELLSETLEMSLSDAEGLRQFFSEAQKEGRSILLATNGARRHENWEVLGQVIDSMSNLLHLDLGEGGDILPKVEGKWNCFGTDRLTVQAICRELRVGLATGVP